MAGIIIKGIREKVTEQGAEILYGPKAEKDERFYLRVHDRCRIEDAIIDRVQIYKAVGRNLVLVSVTARNATDEKTREIHKLGEELLNTEMQLPRFPVASNVTGQVVDTLPEIRRTLQDQVTGTVRWVDCMETLLNRGCDLFIELGPGGILAGLLQRTRKDVNVITVSDAASVRTCAAQLA